MSIDDRIKWYERMMEEATDGDEAYNYFLMAEGLRKKLIGQ